MATAMANGEAASLERAFRQVFTPDAYELINVYKLYDETLEVEIVPEVPSEKSDLVSRPSPSDQPISEKSETLEEEVEADSESV